jgi:DNA polymerase
MHDRQFMAELLRWYVETGADEAIGAAPVDRFAPAPAAPMRAEPQPRPVAPAPRPPPPAAVAPAAPRAPAGTGADAERLAAAAGTLAELEAAVRGFEGCALKRTATNTVFADGVADAPLMIIGEAPGADEDRLGRPFVGRSGQLLDRMLAAIGMSRNRDTYITNVLFWRPPGNRKPTPEEIAQCLPFVLRQVALIQPKIVMLAGGTAAAALLDRVEGITRLRGRWFELAVPGLNRTVPTLPTFHPSFLLRAPARKSEAWRDLMAVKSKLELPQ